MYSFLDKKLDAKYYDKQTNLEKIETICDELVNHIYNYMVHDINSTELDELEKNFPYMKNDLQRRMKAPQIVCEITSEQDKVEINVDKLQNIVDCISYQSQICTLALLGIRKKEYDQRKKKYRDDNSNYKELFSIMKLFDKKSFWTVQEINGSTGISEEQIGKVVGNCDSYFNVRQLGNVKIISMSQEGINCWKYIIDISTKKYSIGEIDEILVREIENLMNAIRNEALYKPQIGDCGKRKMIEKKYQNLRIDFLFKSNSKESYKENYIDNRISSDSEEGDPYGRKPARFIKTKDFNNIGDFKR